MAAEPAGFASQPTARWRLLFELGRGGMGVAHLAMVEGPGGFERLVVVKRLNPELSERAEVVARFLDEARLAACIRHANVIATHDVGRDADGYFLVLEYVEGVNLEELTDRSALRGVPIPVPIALRIGLDALAGLDAAHNARDARGRRLGLLHRDVSLQNVLIGRDGVARLADFGIAKSELSSVVTAEGFVVGKLMYLPPEYLQRTASGPELDVYSLGVTLWVALAGHDPWPGADEAQMIKHILHDGVPPLSAAIEVATEVEEILQSACAMDRAERFSSARAMAERVEGLAQTTGIATHREVADFVERFAGTDLELRRDVVARRRSEVEASSALRGPEDSVLTSEAPVARRRRWARYGLFVGAVALLGAAAAIAVTRVGSRSVAADESPSAAGGLASEVAPTPTPASASASIQVVNEPPAASATPGPTPHASAPAPRSMPVVPAKARASVNDGISTSNPYRK